MQGAAPVCRGVLPVQRARHGHGMAWQGRAWHGIAFRARCIRTIAAQVRQPNLPVFHSSLPLPCSAPLPPSPTTSRATCTCLTNSRPAGRRAASCDGRPASEREQGSLARREAPASWVAAELWLGWACRTLRCPSHARPQPSTRGLAISQLKPFPFPTNTNSPTATNPTSNAATCTTCSSTFGTMSWSM